MTSREFTVGQLRVVVHNTREESGEAAAARTAELIQNAIDQRGQARIIVATGNSQLAFIDALVKHHEVDWQRVEVFHMDEYVGMSADHPASFRKWIRERVVERVRPAAAYYIEGDAEDLEAEMKRYANLLSARVPDLAFVGIGENGHIAFNDPPVADFCDPLVIKRVQLDERCRLQQVGEGHFPDLASTPTEALTLTCPALLAARHLICCVPELRKAQAVRDALLGPISTECPASILRTHGDAVLYLDSESASLLPELS